MTDTTDTVEDPDRQDTAEGPDHRATADQPEGYLVPPDVAPERCPHCGAPFAEDDLLALHFGVEHGDELTDEQRRRYESAREAEAEAIRLFRLQALGVLVLLYFGLLIAFSVFG